MEEGCSPSDVCTQREARHHSIRVLIITFKIWRNNERLNDKTGIWGYLYRERRCSNSDEILLPDKHVICGMST